MTTEYKLNTYIEWTDEDRAKGECPVPEWSNVTLWFKDGGASRTVKVTAYDWGGDPSFRYITAYLIHSVPREPREPIVRWMMVGGECNGFWYGTEDFALEIASEHGGRVVKLVEEV